MIELLLASGSFFGQLAWSLTASSHPLRRVGTAAVWAAVGLVFGVVLAREERSHL
jgi:hypothetical protein